MEFSQTLGVVALEAILLLLLSRLLFTGVIASFADRRGKGLVLGLLRLPGNLVHELSHCLGFLICGYRVRRVLLCMFDPQGRGSCTPGKPWSPITLPHLAVGLSALMPLVVGSAVLLGVGQGLGVVPPVAAAASDDLLPQIWRQAMALLHGLDPHHWQTYLFLYLALSIGAELSPSATDLRYALPTILALCLGVWLFFFALEHGRHLTGYRPVVASLLHGGLLRLGSVLLPSLVMTAAATFAGLIPGLAVQAFRGRK